MQEPVLLTFIANCTVKVKELYHFDPPAIPSSSNSVTHAGQMRQCGLRIDAVNQEALNMGDANSTACTVETQPIVQRLTISDYQRARSTCRSGCICICHVPRRFQVVSANRLIGSLSIVSTAASGKQDRCTETLCSRQRGSVTKVTYRFPYWLLARIMCLTVSMQPQTGINMSLKALSVIPDDAEIMHFAKAGNLEGIRSLITLGLASPLDVNASWGVPVLSVSTY